MRPRHDAAAEAASAGLRAPPSAHQALILLFVYVLTTPLPHPLPVGTCASFTPTPSFTLSDVVAPSATLTPQLAAGAQTRLTLASLFATQAARHFHLVTAIHILRMNDSSRDLLPGPPIVIVAAEETVDGFLGNGRALIVHRSSLVGLADV